MIDALVSRGTFRCSACKQEKPPESLCVRFTDLSPSWTSCSHLRPIKADALLCIPCLIAARDAGLKTAKEHLAGEVMEIQAEMRNALRSVAGREN